MASYTMELREYIESWTPDDGSMTLADRIEAGRTHLFDFDYDIFDETYRSVLETKFIRTFYMREIGFETEGLFKFNLQTWLMINMPYFNKLFEAENEKFDPLINFSMNVTKSNTDTKTSSTNNSGNNSGSVTANGTSSGTSFDRELESNNPDTRLSITPNSDGSGTIEYASNIQENSGNSSSTNSNTSNESGNFSSTSSGNFTDTMSYTENRIGKIGEASYSKMISEYFDSLIRIENQMFKEMQQLFMLVY